MSFTGNAAAAADSADTAAAASAAAVAASAAATSAATAAADKTKMCASSLIFRATKWCVSLAKIFHKYLRNIVFLGGCSPADPKIINCHKKSLGQIGL